MSAYSTPCGTGRMQREWFAPEFTLPMRAVVAASWAGGPLAWLMAWLATVAWHLLHEEQSATFPSGGLVATADALQTARSLAVLFSVTCLIAAAVHVLWAARLTLFARRGGAFLDASGIEIVDWRGRATRIRWEDLRRVDVTSCGGICRPPKVRIRATDQTVALSPYLRDRARLTSEIISRGDLRRDEGDWFPTLRARYTRPA